MAQANTPETPQVGALAVALVRGRITFVRRFNGQRGGFMHVLTMPAASEYDMPQAVEVHATQPLGEVGATWAGKVKLGGIPKSYLSEREDPNTGEIRKVKVQTADNTLFAVE